MRASSRSSPPPSSIGAAVFVHALRPAGQDRIVGAFAEQAVCFPGDIALAAASMITGGIAARHPKLRIAFSHGGGALSILLPRLVHAWNVLPKAKESLAESPAATAKRFFYDALVFDPHAVRFLIDTFGEARSASAATTRSPWATPTRSARSQTGLDERPARRSPQRTRSAS